MSLRDDLRADFDVARTVTGGRLRRAPMNVVAVVTYRLAHLAKCADRHALALVWQTICQLLTGADIHPSADLGPGLFLVHTVGVVIGPGVVAGRNLTLYGTTVLGRREKTGRGLGYPTIGDDVTIYAKATIIGPVTIGDGAQIGAHALVLDDVSAGGRVRGPQPASIDG